jgi:hypothetical protein
VILKRDNFAVPPPLVATPKISRRDTKKSTTYYAIIILTGNNTMTQTSGETTTAAATAAAQGNGDQGQAETIVYQNVTYKGKEGGRLVLDDKRMVYYGSKEADPSPLVVKIAWRTIAKYQISPKSEEKALLKLTSTNNNKTSVFQMANREDLEQIQETIGVYKVVAACDSSETGSKASTSASNKENRGAKNDQNEEEEEEEDEIEVKIPPPEVRITVVDTSKKEGDASEKNTPLASSSLDDTKKPAASPEKKAPIETKTTPAAAQTSIVTPDEKKKNTKDAVPVVKGVPLFFWKRKGSSTNPFDSPDTKPAAPAVHKIVTPEKEQPKKESKPGAHKIGTPPSPTKPKSSSSLTVCSTRVAERLTAASNLPIANDSPVRSDELDSLKEKFELFLKQFKPLKEALKHYMHCMATVEQARLEVLQNMDGFTKATPLFDLAANGNTPVTAHTSWAKDFAAKKQSHSYCSIQQQMSALNSQYIHELDAHCIEYVNDWGKSTI